MSDYLKKSDKDQIPRLFTIEKDSPERFGAGNGDKDSTNKGRP